MVCWIKKNYFCKQSVTIQSPCIKVRFQRWNDMGSIGFHTRHVSEWVWANSSEPATNALAALLLFRREFIPQPTSQTNCNYRTSPFLWHLLSCCGVSNTLLSLETDLKGRWQLLANKLFYFDFLTIFTRKRAILL